MRLYDRLMADIKSAMIGKNNVKRDCLRLIVSDIVVSELRNAKETNGKPVSDETCISVIKKAAKQHNDSIASFRAGNREDLAQKEMEELRYINEYLPRMMTEQETKDAVDNILMNIEAVKKNMGLIMKQLPKEADKKVASKYLSGILK